jgi:hypothetical protein
MLQYSVTETEWVFNAFGDAVFWGTVGERVCYRDIIKDDFGGKLPSEHPRASAFTPRTGFYRPPTR